MPSIISDEQRASKFYRRRDLYLYYLNGKGPSNIPMPAYADANNLTDLPDFKQVGGSVSFFGGAYVYDRYGNQYIMFNVGSSRDFGFNFGNFEGYFSPYHMGMATFNTNRNRSAIPTESKLISFLTPGTFSSTTFSGGMGVGAGIIIGTDGIAILYGAVLAGVGADTPLLGTQLEKKAELNWDWIGRTDTSISRAHIRLDNDEEVECQCMKYFHDPVNIPPVSPPR